MTSKERDNAFEPLVRMGLQSGPVRRGAECADAALIAAFVDRKLTLAERSRWESHFAGCGYCAAVLGATMRVWLELPQAETSHARWWAIPLTGTIAAAALAALFLHLQALNQTMPSPAIVAESARTDELASAEKRQSARTPERAQVEASAPQALALNQPLAPDENALPSAPTAARPREHHRTEPMGEVARESATGRADSSSGDAVRSAARAPREPAERAESYAAPQAGITPTGAGHNAIVGAAVGQAGAGAAIGGALGSGAISLSQSAATESKSGSNPANGAGWAAGFWSADHRVKWAVGANGAIARFTLVSSPRSRSISPQWRPRVRPRR